ncbi:MAG: hypothetical protein WC095_01585 [Candidatus Paceibacterota bacterium]
MQITTPRGNLIERILRDKEGRLVRATFCVYEEAGRVKARLLNFVYIEDSLENEEVLFIDTFKDNFEFDLEEGLDHKIISPYFDFNILTFSGSKPRAPSF